MFTEQQNPTSMKHLNNLCTLQQIIPDDNQLDKTWHYMFYVVLVHTFENMFTWVPVITFGSRFWNMLLTTNRKSKMDNLLLLKFGKKQQIFSYTRKD